MHDLAIKVKNYKCFKDETGFDSFRRVNLVIGRNNSGKSSLLDLIEVIIARKYKFDQATWRANHRPELFFETKITETVVNRAFPKNSYTRGLSNYGFSNDNQYGRRYIDRTIKWTRNGSERTDNALIECDDAGINPPLKELGDQTQILLQHMPVPFQNKVFRRLLAERDILPEKTETKNIAIGINGEGITNAIGLTHCRTA